MSLTTNLSNKRMRTEKYTKLKQSAELDKWLLESKNKGPCTRFLPVNSCKSFQPAQIEEKENGEYQTITIRLMQYIFKSVMLNVLQVLCGFANLLLFYQYAKNYCNNFTKKNNAIDQFTLTRNDTISNPFLYMHLPQNFRLDANHLLYLYAGNATSSHFFYFRLIS